MYYLTKIVQAAGLTVILIDFLRKFPELMDRKILMTGIVIFVLGWLTEKFLLRK